MSQAEELLAALSETVVEHSHPMNDSDSYFVIDPVTRIMDNGSSEPSYIMQYDHDSVILTFELPRLVDGHDMLRCNRVIVHWNNIGESRYDERAESTELEDLRINPKDNSTVICSWRISRNSTQYAGKLTFLVQYKCVEDGVTTYEWHTDIFDNVTIKPGRNNGEQSVIDYTDIIEQWRARLFGASDAAIVDIATAAEEQKESIESKGAETLATIPTDYTETYNMANDALRTRANAIVVTAEGETVVADDCSDDYLRGLHVYGRTTQTSTTGKQLIQTTLGGTTAVTGLKITPLEDGDLVVNGVHAEGAMWLEFGRTSLAAGKTYTLSCAEGFSLHLWDLTNNKEFRTKKLADEYITITATENIDCAVVLNDAVLGRTYVDVRVGAILSESSIPLPWEPYSGGFVSPSPEWPQDLANVENPSVELYGRNLLDQNGEFTSNYSTFSLRANVDHGVIALSGTSMLGYGTLKTSLPLGVFKKGLTYRISRMTKNFHIGFWFYDKDNNNIGSLTTENSLAYTVPDYADHISFFYAGLTPETEVNLTEKFMLNLGTEALPWEPSVDTHSISLAHTLRGIPVDSGGNYTDSNGQQWICDEIDFERGVYIQRVDTIVFDGGKNYHINAYQLNQGFYVYGCIMNEASYSEAPMLSDRLAYKPWGYWNLTSGGNFVCYEAYSFYIHLKDQSINTVEAFINYLNRNPITAQYILKTPVETALTDEELFAFRQLHSNYLVTTALNSENAHMGLVYNADTQKYLSNLFTPTDEQVQAAVDAWLSKHFSNAEGVRF